jgi:hypothetical protein
MAFNPALPQTNSPIVSAELPDQFNGLKDMIDQRALDADVQDLVFTQTAGFPWLVQPLALTVSAPPTQAEMQAIADRFDQLFAALNRA